MALGEHAIADRIGGSRITDLVVPELRRSLAGENRRSLAKLARVDVLILDDWAMAQGKSAATR